MTDISEQELANRREHWRRTRRLMVIHIAIWFFFSFVVHWFAAALNSTSFLGFPPGFYMAAQGALIVFVVQLFVFVWQQDRIDHACGQAEDA